MKICDETRPCREKDCNEKQSAKSSKEEEEHEVGKASEKQIPMNSHIKSDLSELNKIQHDTSHDRSNGIGVQGMVKLFVGKKPFSGSREGDLHSAISIFIKMVNMCHVREPKKLKTIAVLLCEDALLRSLAQTASCETEDDESEVLQK